MTLTSEQWNQVLNASESNNSNDSTILEQIKAELQKQHQDVYEEWKQEDFNENHLFNVSLIIGNSHHHTILTLLHIAALNGCLETIKYLVDEKGVDVNKGDDKGITALHWAAENGHLETVKCLIEKEDDLNRTDMWGNTALHFAVRSDEMDVVKFLLNKGVNPSLKNRDGNTPRDLADSENVKQLLKEAENKQSITKKDIPSIPSVQPNDSHSTKGSKLPIITACAGLLLGLGIAYLAGAAALTPVVAAIAVFVAATVAGALVGYGTGKFCEKVSSKLSDTSNERSGLGQQV